MLSPSAENHCSYLAKPPPSDDTPGVNCMANMREGCRTLDPADDSEGAELVLNDTQVLFQYLHTFSSSLVRLHSIHEYGPAIHSPVRL
jgi:hypothetical protein